MPNTIKYSTGSDSLSLKKGNFYIGVGDVSKYPTSTTGYWSAINPPSGGYTIYEYKSSNGPSIRTPIDGPTLIDYTNRLYGNTSYIGGVSDCLYYLNQNSTTLCVNREYEPIVTDGIVLHLDAGYTPSYYQGGLNWYDMSCNVFPNNAYFPAGIGWAPSYGGWFYFNGTNAYSYITNSTTLSITGNLTASGWVNPTGFSTQGNIISKNSNTGYRMRFQNDGTFWMYSNGNSLTSPSSYTLNNWYYVTAVFSSSGLKMYINGVLVNSNGTAFNPSYSSTAFYIGSFSSTQEFFQGSISIISVYNRELSGTEILQNFNAQKTRYGL